MDRVSRLEQLLQIYGLDVPRRVARVEKFLERAHGAAVTATCIEIQDLDHSPVSDHATRLCGRAGARLAGARLKRARLAGTIGIGVIGVGMCSEMCLGVTGWNRPCPSGWPADGGRRNLMPTLLPHPGQHAR
ncbi:hypothetical protein BLTE_01470 [Blastochloris tepida]|uniref:Uncharacterized protein n=1 Tax=Blastochloris tepida TaxID=2233851 RepID=A0A348FVX9_9HYPH|nr:hypothetical protein BLTE_01470 [Blastochloris tepida]